MLTHLALLYGRGRTDPFGTGLELNISLNMTYTNKYLFYKCCDLIIKYNPAGCRRVWRGHSRAKTSAIRRFHFAEHCWHSGSYGQGDKMKLKAPFISVIIPHLNQPDSLEACLSSLDAQNLDRALFEVIVVDNGSACPPAETIARHPGVRMLRELQSGPGPARNTGARNADSDIFAFVDADCRAHPQWLTIALQTIRSCPERTVLGGDVRIWRGGRSGFTAVEAYESVFSYRFKLYIEQHGFCGTGNMVMHRDAFETVGPFAGIECAEDMEWGERARHAGFRFQYVPKMVVFHPARRSLHELYKQWDRHTQHFRNMADGTPAWKIRWTLRALAILVSPCIDFMKVLTSDRVQGLSARTKAIMILFRVRAHRAWTMLSLLGLRRTIVWNRAAATPDPGARDPMSPAPPNDRVPAPALNARTSKIMPEHP